VLSSRKSMLGPGEVHGDACEEGGNPGEEVLRLKAQAGADEGRSYQRTEDRANAADADDPAHSGGADLAART
jgi:hypothetical protein